MSNTPTNERELRRETQEWLNSCLNILDRCIRAQLSKSDFGSIKPAKREQFAKELLRYLQRRPQFALDSLTEEELALIEETLQALLQPGEPTQ